MGCSNERPFEVISLSSKCLIIHVCLARRHCDIVNCCVKIIWKFFSRKVKTETMLSRCEDEKTEMRNKNSLFDNNIKYPRAVRFFPPQQRAERRKMKFAAIKAEACNLFNFDRVSD